MGFMHVLESQERVLRDAVVPLGDAQRDALAQVRFLRTQLFPQGTAFVHQPMDLQWSALILLRQALEEPECSAVIEALGLRRFAEHVVAHIELYGRILGHDARSSAAGEEKVSAAWTEAFKRYAVQVLHDYPDDAAMQRELLGVYDAQLAQQHALGRTTARARTKKAARAEEAAPPSAPEG